MMPTPTVPITPPRWAQTVLRAWLPDDSMRSAILGDLHEELVRDTEWIGADRARVRYHQRVFGIVAYVIIDAARWRPWTSAPVAVTTSAAPSPRRAQTRGSRSLVGRADMGLIAVAFGVLSVGIVVNTLLFSTVRHVPRPDAQIANSVLGVASLALALGCAGVAAVLLCVGPRWLRRRACREATARRDAAAAVAPDTSLVAVAVPEPHP